MLETLNQPLFTDLYHLLALVSGLCREPRPVTSPYLLKPYLFSPSCPLFHQQVSREPQHLSAGFGLVEVIHQQSWILLEKAINLDGQRTTPPQDGAIQNAWFSHKGSEFSCCSSDEVLH